MIRVHSRGTLLVFASSAVLACLVGCRHDSVQSAAPITTISGGVTVATGLPLTFSASIAQLGQRAASPIGAAPSTRTLVDPAKSAVAVSANGAAERRLVVRFKARSLGAMAQMGRGASLAQSTVQAMHEVLQAHQASGMITLTEPSPAISAARVTVPAGVAVGDAMAELMSDPNVASVTVDEIIPMLETYAATEYQPAATKGTVASSGIGGVPGVLPNNPILFAQLWHYGMVDAPRAWATTTGSASVLVAVVDNGIRFDHPAIAANLTHDGYNFVKGGNRLTTPEPLCAGGTTLLPEAGYGPDPTDPDDLGFTGTCWVRTTVGNHGLHVAGTIGAVGNDGIGTTGLNWTVRIRPVRVLDITGSGSTFDVAQGILYAAGLPASNGAGGTVTAPSAAPIINMSLGGGNDPVMAAAVTAATNAGSLIIAAAGNSQTSFPFYPASYPEVVSVVALGPDMQLASYTNIGSTVSLAAPGGNFRSSGTAGVASTTWNFVSGSPTYAYYAGTSMAAPHVAGVAALVLAASPGLTNAQLRARLQNTAVHLGAPGRDDRYGYGLVNAYNAVNNVVGPQRGLYVRVISATSGDTVRTLPVGADGSYAVTRIEPGTYYVVAGEDEGGDHRIGVPGRRFGWYGPATGPGIVTVAAGQNAIASIHVGTPVESKPNGTLAQANRVFVNGYIVGHITETDPGAIFTVQIPRTGTYYFETTGLVGSCGYGIEVNTVLDLDTSAGTMRLTNDDTLFPGSRFCSQIIAQLSAGTYYLRVTGSGGSTGQFRLAVRDQP